ncbi:MAG: ECF transporter S component [Lachnospiraceae bacterium]|nr:ECF transporter S component [Lachnospiraceae bacterium]
MKLTTKGLVQTALLLAICIASQYFKNLSVYITGPIVNTTIIIAVLAAGLWSGLLISIVAPVTAFFFTGSPIMAAIPLMFPVVMAGNAILAVSVWYFQEKLSASWRLPAGLIAGSVLKAIFMGVVVVLIILPFWGNNIAGKLPKPEALPKVLATARVTFSITQLITALIGSALAYIIWMPLKKYLKSGQE